ncbi:MAG: hypothetical protein ACTSQY_03410 [Candidatus Odinarchaeia archaeon]
MSDEKISELKNLLKEAWKSPSIIIKTPDYIYALKKEDGGWQEISYMFAEKDLQKRTLNSENALLFLIEELTKSLVQYSPQLQENIIVDAGKLDEILNSL